MFCRFLSAKLGHFVYASQRLDGAQKYGEKMLVTHRGKIKTRPAFSPFARKMSANSIRLSKKIGKKVAGFVRLPRVRG